MPFRLTFTSTDEKIAIRSDSAEGQIHNRPSVTGTRERSLPHSHFYNVKPWIETGNDRKNNNIRVR